MADALILIPGQTEKFEEELIEFINRGQSIAQILKKNESGINFFAIPHEVRINLLDSYMDQLVTVLGSAYTQHYDVLGAANEIDTSNWSKFDDEGQPIFDQNKKVKKGPNYRKAVLDSFVLDVVMSFPQEKETTTSMEKVMNELIQVSTSASYEELREAQDRLSAQINAKRAQARAEGISKIVSLVKEFDLTADELNQALTGKGKPGRKAGVKLGKTSTSAAPKYRDPVSGATWTGRGVAPGWIKDVAKDARDAFLITKAEDAPVAAEPEAQVASAEPVEATAPVFGNTVED